MTVKIILTRAKHGFRRCVKGCCKKAGVLDTTGLPHIDIYDLREILLSNSAKSLSDEIDRKFIDTANSYIQSR